jgi:5-oxoprolinase (ATP-hydrolysing)
LAKLMSRRSSSLLPAFTVQWQLDLHGDSLRPGDVLMTNHPSAGNSHLPDITLITPVFEGDKIIFFVASRGHHADIGGILAGSMPPTSTELYQEGAMWCVLRPGLAHCAWVADNWSAHRSRSFFIVKAGTFNRDDLYRIMVEEPAQYEGCSGCRSFSDVESDLKAQIAANHKGAQLLGKLIKEYGLPTVHAYMDFIRDNAELAIRELLKRTAATYGTKLSALDHMDDGSPIALEITIDPADGSAIFDFEGVWELSLHVAGAS